MSNGSSWRFSDARCKILLSIVCLLKHSRARRRDWAWSVRSDAHDPVHADPFAGSNKHSHGQLRSHVRSAQPVLIAEYDCARLGQLILTLAASGHVFNGNWRVAALLEAVRPPASELKLVAAQLWPALATVCSVLRKLN